MHYSPIQIFIQLKCRIPVISMCLQVQWKIRVDPDQLASQKPAVLDLHYFQNRIYLGLALIVMVGLLMYIEKQFLIAYLGSAVAQW